ncbi:ATP-binding protein [Actinosynnema pretiosum]|uniref:Anti-sigma factor n=1 Tax=Actinosynnema pretiosum TaxID=42197 RepID=A0A290ZBJ9_9PSEU|nr:ATP-binding protein [Actinosynnema pretiosum]ATE56421.1 anti-sigma factor [Actinosynnema pretiosum]
MSHTEPHSGELDNALSGVELRMAADPTQLSIVRAVAADIAMRQDFDLDSIEDLKLAVDEACSTLISLASKGAVLSARFVVADGDVQVSTQVVSERAAPPDRDSFGWRVLSALVDSVTTWVAPKSGEEAYEVHIDLVKRSLGTVDA